MAQNEVARAGPGIATPLLSHWSELDSPSQLGLCLDYLGRDDMS